VAELERDLAAETLKVKAVRLLFDTLNEFIDLEELVRMAA
jgi:hypothetical protein